MQLVRAPRLPEFEDDIPEHPGWAYWEDGEKRYWATRYGPKAYGIVCVPESQLALAYGPVIRTVKPFAALVEIAPNSGWQFTDPIEEHQADSELEAYVRAEKMREEFETLVMLNTL